nr:NAD(P)-binding protein [Sphingomicrobium sp. B8]
MVVGAGTSGLAFADTLLAEDPDAAIAIVDKHARPGGHWNDAYSFVRLHQPSTFYGVNSVELSRGTTDTDGLNKGFLELATGAEVSAYFERVMEKVLLPSGRVTYYPSHEYVGDDRIRSVLTGDEQVIDVRRKTVDSTYYGTTVPSTHTPKFEVEEGERLVPPNELPFLWKDGVPSHYAVLGGGKTAMDSVNFLLGQGVAPDSITWVRPRDAWWINRATVQPGIAHFETTFGAQAAMMEARAAASDVHDLFARYEKAGAMLRIDPEVTPTMFHFATAAPAEVTLSGSVKNVVRKGHVRSITAGVMRFDDGEVAVADDTLFVDCTAPAVTRRPTRPLFEDDRITLQMVRIPQPAFSAALTAFLEARFDSDEEKNSLARPIPLPDGLEGYPLVKMVDLLNQRAWTENEVVRRWLSTARLDGFGETMKSISQDDTQKMAILGRMRAASQPAFANLMRLVQLANEGG